MVMAKAKATAKQAGVESKADEAAAAKTKWDKARSLQGKVVDLKADCKAAGEALRVARRELEELLEGRPKEDPRQARLDL